MGQTTVNESRGCGLKCAAAKLSDVGKPYIRRLLDGRGLIVWWDCTWLFPKEDENDSGGGEAIIRDHLGTPLKLLVAAHGLHSVELELKLAKFKRFKRLHIYEDSMIVYKLQSSVIPARGADYLVSTHPGESFVQVDPVSLDIEGKTVKELQFITHFPCALGDVISALASKTSHSPYGNSKITHLLLSSLGGPFAPGTSQVGPGELSMVIVATGPEKKVIEDDFTSAAIKTFNSRSKTNI
ncbi:hypothetical protein C5167_031096 [Papaver somniferum]|nr:hypothetical protein C5167_031096 [Papaver somniferum]